MRPSNIDDNRDLQPQVVSALRDLLEYQSAQLLTIGDQLRPHWQICDQPLQVKLDALLIDHRQSAAAISDLLLSDGHPPDTYSIAADYTHLHYTSVRCLMPIVLRELHGLIDRYRQVLSVPLIDERSRLLLDGLIQRKQQLLRESADLLK